MISAGRFYGAYLLVFAAEKTLNFEACIYPERGIAVFVEKLNNLAAAIIWNWTEAAGDN